MTPLMMAAAGGWADAVEELVAAGADVDAASPDGKKALDYAAERMSKVGADEKARYGQVLKLLGPAQALPSKASPATPAAPAATTVKFALPTPTAAPAAAASAFSFSLAGGPTATTPKSAGGAAGTPGAAATPSPFGGAGFSFGAKAGATPAPPPPTPALATPGGGFSFGGAVSAGGAAGAAGAATPLAKPVSAPPPTPFPHPAAPANNAAPAVDAAVLAADIAADLSTALAASLAPAIAASVAKSLGNSLGGELADKLQGKLADTLGRSLDAAVAGAVSAAVGQHLGGESSGAAKSLSAATEALTRAVATAKASGDALVALEPKVSSAAANTLAAANALEAALSRAADREAAAAAREAEARLKTENLDKNLVGIKRQSFDAGETHAASLKDARIAELERQLAEQTLNADGLREQLGAEEQRRLVAERSYMASADERARAADGNGTGTGGGAAAGATNGGVLPASTPNHPPARMRPATASWANAAPFRPLGFDSSAANATANAGIEKLPLMSPAGPPRDVLDRFGETPPLASLLLAPVRPLASLRPSSGCTSEARGRSKRRRRVEEGKGDTTRAERGRQG